MRQELFTLLRKAADLAVEFIVKYSFQVLGAIVILLVGMKLAQWLSQLFVRICQKRKVDVTLTRFAAGLLRGTVIAFALIIALEKFGITIAPFIAAIGALAFGGSFAIQGPLSNFAAGLSIVLGKPFSVGDTINVIGVSGVVEEIKLGYTILSTEDGERITIPNKHIVGEVIRNSKEHQMIESVVGVSYGNDPERAIQLIQQVLKRFPQVASQPAAQVGIREFGDSSINLGLRYWVPTRQRFQMLYAVNLALFKALGQAGVTIPFPQRDLHIVANADGSPLKIGPQR